VNDKMTSLYENIKFKLFIWKLQLNLRLSWNKDKYARKRLCRKGYHKLRVGSVSWGHFNKRMTTVRYLKCMHCEYIFFTSKREKAKYMNKRKAEKILTAKMFERTMKIPKEHRDKEISKLPEGYG